MPRFISYAQNGEDVRIWRAFGPRCEEVPDANLTYVDVGANEPRELSLTAALYDLGWRGVLVEADPDLANRLRDSRPGDTVVEVAAADVAEKKTFYRVPGTGLGTLDKVEARAAFERGFAVVESLVSCQRLDDILAVNFEDDDGVAKPIHVMSIDVEGSEATVLSGLSLARYRPWVLCIEAVEPGTNNPTHEGWEGHILDNGYREVAFDGVNRWYVANEHADELIAPLAGGPAGTTIADAIATPFHAIDIGAFGWRTAQVADLQERHDRNCNRQAWQRELILHDLEHQVSDQEYERQIDELRTVLINVQESRTFALSRLLSRAGKRALHVARHMRRLMPGPLRRKLIEQQHLKHVTVNMGHLTDSAFLGIPETIETAWMSSPRPPMPAGLDLQRFTSADASEVRAWLSDYRFDSDVELDKRMDNHDDEVGRVRAALRTRLRIHDAPANPHWAGGNRIAFDARALQSPAFGTRGIGRFAKAALLGAREALDDQRITLVVDRGLHPLPDELAGDCLQVTAIRERDVAQYSMLIQPSPMTHSADPLIPLLHSNAYSIAVVFDFIPMRYPNVYLRHPAARAEYAANLDALKCYQDFVCISKVARDELARVLEMPRTGPNALQAVVAWPREITQVERGSEEKRSVDREGPIVLVTGDEPRKNTFGGLAGIAAATSDEAKRNVVVVGLAGQDVRVHHWSIAAAMRPGEAQTYGRMSDTELEKLLAQASCVVVPSFDEGLSLPVIEAVQAGAPVVASDISAHRELIGRGRFSFNAAKPRSIARAVKRTRGRNGVRRAQTRKLARHNHASLEAVVAKRIVDHVRPAVVAASVVGRATNAKISIGVATPWVPQRTGVADFSTAVFSALAHHVDLTVYTTSGAQVDVENSPHARLEQRSIDEIFADPEAIQRQHDVLISVVGNSHYHLPFVEVLKHVDAIAIAHDTRMIEYYMALRGKGGVENLMLTSVDIATPQTITPPLDDQIDDMRLLQNAGFWEIARRASKLVLHSLSAAPEITRQTGVPIYLLPFANQRVPKSGHVTTEDRSAARERLGLGSYPEGTIHLGSFGYIDPRTKMTDVVVESAAWLAQWGYPVALHLVGSANAQQERELAERAAAAGVPHFQITGFQEEAEFRDWLMAIDLGVQLRISPLLGVSGPLSDLAAFGTPSVASSGLCVDVDTPEYINSLPESVSPVMVAEAIEQCLLHPVPEQIREQQRQAYLASQSPEGYAELLFELIQDHVR